MSTRPGSTRFASAARPFRAIQHVFSPLMYVTLEKVIRRKRRSNIDKGNTEYADLDSHRRRENQEEHR